MRITTGKVVGGKVVIVDAPLAEGQSVTVLAAEEGETFELDSTAEAALLAAMRELDGGEALSGDDLIATLPPRA
jgi:hypothetical protein